MSIAAIRAKREEWKQVWGIWKCTAEYKNVHTKKESPTLVGCEYSHSWILFVTHFFYSISLACVFFEWNLIILFTIHRQSLAEFSWIAASNIVESEWKNSIEALFTIHRFLIVLNFKFPFLLEILRDAQYQGVELWN